MRHPSATLVFVQFAAHAQLLHSSHRAFAPADLCALKPLQTSQGRRLLIIQILAPILLLFQSDLP